MSNNEIRHCLYLQTHVIRGMGFLFGFIRPGVNDTGYWILDTGYWILDNSCNLPAGRQVPDSN